MEAISSCGIPALDRRPSEATAAFRYSEWFTKGATERKDSTSLPGRAASAWMAAIRIDRAKSPRLARELRLEDMLPADNRNSLRIKISAGYAPAEEDSLIKELLAKAESKDSLYSEFVLH